MLRLSLALLATLGTVPFLTLDASTDGEAALAPPPCGGNTLEQEPVLIWDQTGSTLIGPVHARLSVDNSGLATASGTSSFFESESAATTVVPPSAVIQLRSDLANAGALVLCDQQLVANDIPLTTVTVFAGATNARTHTFSYWAGFDEYAASTQIVQEFRSTWFPDS